MTDPTSRARQRRSLVLTAAFALLASVLAACSSGTASAPTTKTVTATATRTPTAVGQPSSGTSSTHAKHTKPAKPKGKPVHVSLKYGDGVQVGVGLPIIAFLSRPIKDARAFAQATKVTVNGKPVNGGWYFERKYGDPGHPIEADYRMSHYWPGHARIHMDLPVKGLSAGTGLVYDDNLTLDFTTGPANVLTVDDATHRLTVMSDGKLWGKFPVSLGYPKTPTKRGIKVIMEKGRDVEMKGPGYDDPHVKYTQRLTYDGEYLHSAPWNCTGHPGCRGPQNNIGKADSSNGCTNLRPHDAIKLYHFLEVGDVVSYPNANGPRMQLGDGYGDWNLSWSLWQTGGLYSVR